MTRYYEDFAVGDTWNHGTRRVTSEDITTFAREYDPQPMHLDPNAEHNTFGGLIASGWHTAALTMRLYVDGVLEDAAVRAGLGVDDLRWPTPVRPGDELAIDVEVRNVEPFDDERGRVDMAVTTTNQNDEEVLSMVVKGLYGRRGSGQ